MQVLLLAELDTTLHLLWLNCTCTSAAFTENPAEKDDSRDIHGCKGLAAMLRGRAVCAGTLTVAPTHCRPKMCDTAAQQLLLG